MSVNIEKALQWMIDRAGKVSYSMSYRWGPNSYDCSSAVSNALEYAGGRLASGIGNTETMYKDLPKAGWVEVTPNADGSIDAQRGDIFLWGDEGYSAGAGGHTGFFLDPDNIIHCNYGYNNITINNHDYIWSLNGRPTCRIFRYKGFNAGSATATGVSHPNPRDAEAPRWIVESGDTFNKIMNYYFGRGAWSNADLRVVAEYNGIANVNVLHVGQEIYIPGPLYWVVEPGDTWQKIATYYGYRDVKKFANRIGGELTVGRKLTIWQ